jgi:16S rRNA (guanine1207-N2)-methyltransferase
LPIASQHRSDPALDTLMLPFETGVLDFGPDVLFLRAKVGAGLPPEARGWICEQGFRPDADALQSAGLMSLPRVPDGKHLRVLLLLPRQRDQSRALLARGLANLGPDGVLVASLANNEGARSAEADLSRLAGNVHSLSKNKCRVFWVLASGATIDDDLQASWLALDAPRPIADGRFLSRPGLFAWDRIDEASAMLAACLPGDLQGRGADLGAGFGYLASEVLSRCAAVTSLDLYEADHGALELARQNLDRSDHANPRVQLGFHWHDVSSGLPGRYEFIVSNPPFHQGRADLPELGRAFINAAAQALLPGGRLWLVANRHLPYEAALAKGFAKVRVVEMRDGFKVIEAVKANP